MKRVFSLILALVMLIGLMPAVSASETIASGVCGENLTWVLTEDGTLTISGAGKMDDYSSDYTKKAPWQNYATLIKSVNVKNGITSIGNHSFEFLNAMCEITLPSTLTSIGIEAFYRCTSLESIVLPESLEELGWGALSGCDSITTVTIPSKIEVIEDETFFGCDNLTSVVLPDGLKSIGYYAFGLSSLANINIPASVTYIDGRAFHWTPWEENLDGGYIVVGDHVLIGYYDDDTPLHGTAVIPKGVKYIAPNAFGFDEMEEVYYGDCWGISDIVLPDSLLEIGYWAFNYQEIESIKIPSNVRFIDYGAFSECYNLNTVYFEGDVPVLAEDIFNEDILTAYYPENNPTWTEDLLMDYEGDVAWIGYQSFKDVPANSFFFEPVVWASTKNITSGSSKTTFSPGNQCLRAHVVTFLWNAEKTPEPAATVSTFTDVPANAWYKKPVLWAVENGITSGISPTEFGAGDVCARYQVVYFLWKAAGSPKPKTTVNPFTDVKTSHFFYDAVLWAVENDITSGTSETTFSPAAPCNRAQVVTFLYKAYN